MPTAFLLVAAEMYTCQAASQELGLCVKGRRGREGGRRAAGKKARRGTTTRHNERLSGQAVA
jgi:hypothetical protein